MIRRRVKLKITTGSRQTFERQALILRLYCPICEHDVELLSSALAANVLEVGIGALKQLLADGQIHAVQTVSGHIRVCKDSLFLM
jgi:hypothetical protein